MNTGQRRQQQSLSPHFCQIAARRDRWLLVSQSRAGRKQCVLGLTDAEEMQRQKKCNDNLLCCRECAAMSLSRPSSSSLLIFSICQVTLPQRAGTSGRSALRWCLVPQSRVWHAALPEGNLDNAFRLKHAVQMDFLMLSLVWLTAFQL